jgi:hypothetical protein
VGETYLVVFAGVVGTATSITSITFGATSLAALVAITGSTSRRGALWGGTVPASTTATLTVTWSGTNVNAVVAAVPYSGVVSVGTGTSDNQTTGTTSTITLSEVGLHIMAINAIMTAFADNNPTPAQATIFTRFDDGANIIEMDGSGATNVSTLSWSGLNHANGNSIAVGITLLGTAEGGGSGQGEAVTRLRYHRYSFGG